MTSQEFLGRDPNVEGVHEVFHEDKWVGLEGFPLYLAGGFKYFLDVHPEIWGVMVQFDEHTFQMGG